MVAIEYGDIRMLVSFKLLECSSEAACRVAIDSIPHLGPVDDNGCNAILCFDSNSHSNFPASIIFSPVVTMPNNPREIC